MDHRPEQPSAGEPVASAPRRRAADFAPLALRWRVAAPLDLRILGRTLLHAAAVGIIAGLLGGAFFAALEVTQRLLLEGIAGYAPARARGETFLGPGVERALRPWLLALLPALGGLVSGLVTTRFCPEAAGGGGDAAIESYHRGGVVRRRVLLAKPLAAIATLATGGAGGREGPTMQIGAAVGAWVARLVPGTARERRILLVAGIAAGISAVFRTPLGAALLATEMLYRDDFESDALVPAILASVVAYSVVISMFGETTLFGHPRRFPFVPAHLVLYTAVAIVVALAGVAFVSALRAVQRRAAALPVPPWAKPALGGLAMGVFGTVLALGMERAQGPGAGGLGVFGGGYGLAQAAISGREGLPAGWALVALFLGLAVAKGIAASLTIGSGAAAGDFAPSLVMGGLLGGGLGEAARLLLGDPRIDPGAFALVGMGTFYGGLAHAPLSALVLVCELAGSYDLLVPMMLSVSVAFVALRRWTLYAAQPASKAESPAFRHEAVRLALDAALGGLTARDALAPVEVPPVRERATLDELRACARSAASQAVLLVVGASGEPRGVVDLATVRELRPDDLRWLVAADLALPFVAVRPETPLAEVEAALHEGGLAQVPVWGDGGLAGFVGEEQVARAGARVLLRT